MIVAIYPGTFDPIHHGHLDIARRAAQLFDKLVIGVYDRPNKDLLFSVEERVGLFREAVADITNASVVPYSGLTVAFARAQGARVIVRGLRVTYDFEYEYQMALTNRKLDSRVDTVCLMTSLEHAFLSSTIVKDVARAGGNIRCMVPEHVARAVADRLRNRADTASSGREG
ncbi:MAG: pantetheine-phosphate adenylyltransferase [Anaerolineae bacterium]|nr:pantetheine-phosphate adenylyltransferase [Anaerolineae bacterium]